MADPKKNDQPVAPDVGAMQAIVAEQARQIAEMRDQLVSLQKIIAVERPMAIPLREQQEREQRFEAIKAEIGKPCSQRTQEEAVRRWGKETGKRFKVKLTPNSPTLSCDQPELLIPANSIHEAKARYDDVCGIRSVDPDKYLYINEPMAMAG